MSPSDSCSDASRGPLYYRLELWRQRLDVAGQVAGWIAVYREAANRCELPHGRDRRALLELIQQRVDTTAQAASLLGALQGSSRAFVRRQLMRRAIDADFAAALRGRDPVNWAIADGVLARAQTAEERIRELRRLCGERSTSLGCVERLVAALRQAGQPDQALVEVERARANGLLTPRIVQLLGDLLVELGRVDDARRAYSELVEFAPSDPNARQLLGDIYRRQGWHQDAYRQYQTLVARRHEDPTATLRLAAAAAGSGRVDQALRLERQVAGGEGEPGPADPRRWARLWSALRLARLLTDGTQRSASTLQGLQRSLQRLQLQPTPGVLALLSWDDLDATLALELGSAANGRVAAEAIDAGRTGLFALALPGRAAGELPLVLRGTRLPGTRRVAARLTLLRWDGRRFHATQQDITLAPPGDAAGGPVAKELLANAS
ncbi:MAG: tetratricopeptide repeat protein [Proteobacteria bacterium]|nr:tetratricopeptide repeat protein [Pseudomonadota bacterium]